MMKKSNIVQFPEAKSDFRILGSNLNQFFKMMEQKPVEKEIRLGDSTGMKQFSQIPEKPIKSDE